MKNELNNPIFQSLEKNFNQIFSVKSKKEKKEMKRKKEKKEEERIVDAVIDENEDTAGNSEAIEPIMESCGDENLQQMITDFNLDFQDSSGVLKNPNPSERFKVVERAIAPLAPEILQDIQGIDDYMDSTEASMPIIAQTPEGFFILDGKDMIESAKTAGETSIFCEIDRIAEHNLTDLFARKAGIRSQTRGGRARYAELARNAAKLEAKLLQENDLVSFRHGGRRIGESFVGDSEKDVRTVMVERLSKSRNTVNNYIAHTRYVSDVAMSQLVRINKEKDFFERFGKLKVRLVERLQEQRKTPDEITTEVSTLILQCAIEGFPEPVPVRPQSQVASTIRQEEQPEMDEDEDVNDETDVENANAPIPADEYSDNPIESAKRSTREVSARLSQEIEAANDATTLYTVLIDEIRALNSIVSRIEPLVKPDSATEQQAA